MKMRTCDIKKDYHRDVRAYLDSNFPDRWIGLIGSFEYPFTISRFNPT
jgi:hypothetical protein